MKTKKVTPSTQHMKYRKALVNAIATAGTDLDADVLLALTCHFVGQLIALQDQSRFSTAAVMQLVSENIEQGNKEAIDSLKFQTKGNA